MLDGPDMESMKLADEYGIYIGMSHHEPCMRSGGEYSKVRGSHSPYGDAWDYVKKQRRYFEILGRWNKEKCWTSCISYCRDAWRKRQ